MHIHMPTLKTYRNLPSVYKLPDGGTVSAFDKLTDQDRVSRYNVYPVTGEPALTEWQEKSNPQYTFTNTEAQVSYTITDMPVTERKAVMVRQVYRKAASLIDAQAEGYSQVEIASWPKIRAEVRTFNSSGSVGPEMQAVIDMGLHTAQSLSDVLTPKADHYDAVLMNRNALTASIQAVGDTDTDAYTKLDAIDIDAGWPA